MNRINSSVINFDEMSDTYECLGNVP